MRALDACSKNYTRKSEIVADLVNYAVYDGKQIVREGDISEKDTTELSALYKKNKKKMEFFYKNRFRDVLRKCTLHETPDAKYLIVGVENQDKVHYAMCVRNMLMDAINYATQVEVIADKNRKREGNLPSAEFLSGMKTTDRLKPVITLVVYWGEEKWDAARSLHEMQIGQRTVCKIIRG